MNATEKALALQKEGFSCSQAVFVAFCERFGVDKEQAYKISSGFGGGMHLDQTCGAVTGAIMVIGLKYGRTRADDIDAKIKTIQMTDEFAKKFRQRHGSIGCTKLLGCNLGTPQGREEAKKKGAANKILCSKYVQSAAEILDEILAGA